MLALGRILYISPTSNSHDARFVEAWRKQGFVVRQVISNNSLPSVAQAEVESVIGEFKPDIIQAGPLPIANLSSYSDLGVPLIGTSWGYDVLSDFESFEKGYEGLIRESLRKIDWMFIDTKAGADKVSKLGFEKDKLSVFPWGADDIFFQSSGAQSQKPQIQDGLIFFTNRSHEDIYRVERVIESYMEAKIPKSLLLVGGLGSQTDYLKSIVPNVGTVGEVRFIGHQNEMDLCRTYALSHIYISAASVDGSSVSLLEALASGCVPVVSDIPGNREWVDSSNGFLFKEGKNDLSNVLKQISSLTQQEIVGLSRKCHLVAKERAMWSRNMLNLASVFRKLVEKAE